MKHRQPSTLAILVVLGVLTVLVLLAVIVTLVVVIIAVIALPDDLNASFKMIKSDGSEAYQFDRVFYDIKRSA